MVRNHILRLTPIGTNMNDVIEVIDANENWRIWQISYEWGFEHPRGSVIDPVFIGDKFIRVYAGRYWPAMVPVGGFLMETSVSIFWGFDEDGELIEVSVLKAMR